MSQAHFPFKVNIASLQLNGALESHPELSADTCASECRAFRARRGELAAPPAISKAPSKGRLSESDRGPGGDDRVSGFLSGFFLQSI